MRQVPQSWIKFQQLVSSQKGRDDLRIGVFITEAKCSAQLPTHFIKAGYLVKTNNGYKYNGPKDFTANDWISVLTVYKQYNDSYNQRILNVDVEKSIPSTESTNQTNNTELTDSELINELKARGYTGTIEKKQTINF